ncbi:MAG: hypothetical protein V7L11_06065 [Nostoc sp.]|uniref:hypothetical protein n=1 Tax=Nostoc sp. TaxID=1180 RepID=UPI002FF9022C
MGHSLGIGHWALGIGHGALGIGHWALGIGKEEAGGRSSLILNFVSAALASLRASF